MEAIGNTCLRSTGDVLVVISSMAVLRTENGKWNMRSDTQEVKKLHSWLLQKGSFGLVKAFSWNEYIYYYLILSYGGCYGRAERNSKLGIGCCPTDNLINKAKSC